MLSFEKSLNRFEKLKEMIKKYGFVEPVIYESEIETIINALEKQIPKKPYDVEEREESIENGFYYLGFMCPSCNEPVIGQPYRPKFCKHCGQKLDW